MVFPNTAKAAAIALWMAWLPPAAQAQQAYTATQVWSIVSNPYLYSTETVYGGWIYWEQASQDPNTGTSAFFSWTTSGVSWLLPPNYTHWSPYQTYWQILPKDAINSQIPSTPNHTFSWEEQTPNHREIQFPSNNSHNSVVTYTPPSVPEIPTIPWIWGQVDTIIGWNWSSDFENSPFSITQGNPIFREPSNVQITWGTFGQAPLNWSIFHIPTSDGSLFTGHVQWWIAHWTVAKDWSIYNWTATIPWEINVHWQ